MTPTSQIRHHRFIWIISGVYYMALSLFMIHRGTWFTPDQFIIFGVILVLLLKRRHKTIQDWLSFIFVLLAYEFLRGVIPAIIKFPIHGADVISLERSIFSVIPTVSLQANLYKLIGHSWYDYACSLIYITLYAEPILFALYLRKRALSTFKYFSMTFLLLIYLGYITYIIFPSMPPWMASIKGLLPPVYRILVLMVPHITNTSVFKTLYLYFSPNETAAIPSLHAAIPTLVLLFSIKRKNILLIGASCIYAIIMYFSVVYLGEHYIVDVIAGVVYAVIADITMVNIRRFSHFLDSRHEVKIPQRLAKTTAAAS
jgi:membrane-associated phospholipid phosphatase